MPRENGSGRKVRSHAQPRQPSPFCDKLPRMDAKQLTMTTYGLALTFAPYLLAIVIAWRMGRLIGRHLGQRLLAR